MPMPLELLLLSVQVVEEDVPLQTTDVVAAAAEQLQDQYYQSPQHFLLHDHELVFVPPVAVA